MANKMKIRTDEIKNRNFKVSFRGYDKDEVRQYLISLVSEIESSQREYDELKNQHDVLNSQLKNINDIQKAIENTILQAKDVAEKATQNVEKEKELIIKEATIEAQKLIDRAKIKVSDMENVYVNIINEKNALVARIKSLLLSLSSMLNTWELDDEKIEKESLLNLGIDAAEADNLKKSQLSHRINDIIKNLE
jgi:cell division initiation protein